MSVHSLPSNTSSKPSLLVEDMLVLDEFVEILNIGAEELPFIVRLVVEALSLIHI